MCDDSVHIAPMTGHLMVPEAYIAAAVTLFCIGFIGFFSNLLVIILMCREKKLWTPLNVILFNLVLSDFSVSILGNPFTLASSVARRWLFGRLMCVVYGFFMSLLGISSITTLTVLSFERYIIISRPFKRNHLSHKGALMMVFGIWAYALALTTPPLFGWGDYVNEAANISCSVNWETKSYNATTYILFLFALGLVVPVVVICFSYINIIRTMKRNMIAMGRVTKAESRVAFMVAVMIVAFFIAWTPYAFLALLVHFGNSEVSPGYAVVPALVAKSSICYNPVIYVGLNTQFRSAWKRLLRVHSSGDNSCEVVATTEGNVNHATNPSQAVQNDAVNQPKSTSITNIITNYKRKPKRKSVLVIVSKQKDTTSVSQIYCGTESAVVTNKKHFLFKNKDLKKTRNINDSCDLVELNHKPKDNEKEDIMQHSV